MSHANARLTEYARLLAVRRVHLRIDRELKEVYTKAGHPERWKLFREDVAHVETPAMRNEALAFLRKWI